MFITGFTNARHMYVSWARSRQSIPSHPTSWRSKLRTEDAQMVGATVQSLQINIRLTL